MAPVSSHTPTLRDRADDPRPSHRDRARQELAGKLGVHPGARVALIGVTDPEVVDAMGYARADVVTAEPGAHADIALFEITGLRDLWLVPHAAETIRNDGSLWVMWPKARIDLRLEDVRTTGFQAGLADVKTASVSGALAGLRFVRRSSAW